MWTIHPPAVAECVRQVVNANVPVIAGAVLVDIQWEFRQRCGAAFFMQNDKRHPLSVTAKQREVRSVRGQRSSKRQRTTTTGAKRRHAGTPDEGNRVTGMVPHASGNQTRNE